MAGSFVIRSAASIESKWGMVLTAWMPRVLGVNLCLITRGKVLDTLEGIRIEQELLKFGCEKGFKLPYYV